jgi:aryl-alcohol dehydrogenase-like predicted oxidoreductase
VSRDELFVTTKLAAEVKSYEKAVEAIDGSLNTIGLDHLDLMIVHSPQPWREFRAAVDPLHAATRPAAAAENPEPRTHEQQRPRRLRDLQRGPGDAEEHRPAR